MAVGRCLLLPFPGAMEGLCLCLTAWETLVLGHLACDGAESPEQLAHSTWAAGEQDRSSPPVPAREDLPLSDAWGWAGL